MLSNHVIFHHWRPSCHFLFICSAVTATPLWIHKKHLLGSQIYSFLSPVCLFTGYKTSQDGINLRVSHCGQPHRSCFSRSLSHHMRDPLVSVKNKWGWPCLKHMRWIQYLPTATLNSISSVCSISVSEEGGRWLASLCPFLLIFASFMGSLFSSDISTYCPLLSSFLVSSWSWLVLNLFSLSSTAHTFFSPFILWATHFLLSVFFQLWLFFKKIFCLCAKKRHLRSNDGVIVQGQQFLHGANDWNCQAARILAKVRQRRKSKWKEEFEGKREKVK